MRVHELAKELGLTNKEAVDLCLAMGIDVKSHSSSIIEAQADRVRRRAERDGLVRDEQPEEPKPEKKAAAKKAPAKKAAAKKAADSTTEKAEKKTAPKTGSVSLPQEYFGIEPNVSVMHQVVTAQLAHRRAGTQSTKTRSEVRGGGKKPFSQKGTGNARQGSTRAPHFSGGAVALGPKPRKYSQKTPKKMIKIALQSALSDRANEGKVVVVDAWNFETPKTSAAQAALAALNLEGRILLVVRRDEINAIRSFRNLPEVQLIEIGELNAYDVLCNDYILFSKASLPGASKDGQ